MGMVISHKTIKTVAVICTPSVGKYISVKIQEKHDSKMIFDHSVDSARTLSQFEEVGTGP